MENQRYYLIDFNTTQLFFSDEFPHSGSIHFELRPKRQLNAKTATTLPSNHSNVKTCTKKGQRYNASTQVEYQGNDESNIISNVNVICDGRVMKDCSVKINRLTNTQIREIIKKNKLEV